jgi:thymidylate synthase ThyX
MSSFSHVDNTEKATYQRCVYPLDTREYTEEQIAVAFAMTSRRPDSFRDNAKQLTEEKAADFHERWVLGYGHASVAEHAVLHMAVENISRLACDTLEDNRLASYTEKSSRFQVLPRGYYHVPSELDQHSPLKELYVSTCDYLFEVYHHIVEQTQVHLRAARPLQDGKRDSAYNLRLRREATDSSRFLLPAATLTNVGVTMNGRVMEHAISKLLSSDLAEERELGEELKQEGQKVTPTLIKYAESNPYLVTTHQRQRDFAEQLGNTEIGDGVEARLVHCDSEAELKVTAALLYRFAQLPYAEVWKQVQAMDQGQRWEIINACLDQLGDHDSPVRELEFADYTFDFLMDYGAYREFKRHRMQSYIPQPLTVACGYRTPDLIVQAGLSGQFHEAMNRITNAYWQVYELSPTVAQYLVTHAHYRRVLAKMNLRECYHLFKLRTSPQAHFSIQEPVKEAMKQAKDRHPRLFDHLQLRT